MRQNSLVTAALVCGVVCVSCPPLIFHSLTNERSVFSSFVWFIVGYPCRISRSSEGDPAYRHAISKTKLPLCEIRMKDNEITFKDDGLGFRKMSVDTATQCIEIITDEVMKGRQ